MISSLVTTKLHAPSLRPGLVERPRLVDRVQRGSQTRLTLISAPPGFGKTTLVAAHVAAHGSGRAAWLSLDRQDDEPVAFWSHILGALQTVSPGLGAGVGAALQAGEVPGEPLLGSLINELAALSNGIDLVLDDYHVIERPEIHDGLGFLLDRMPHGMHLVISTRSDPPLPLARLRARGELVEIRAADLRFTAEEARSYLNGTMGLELAPGDLTALSQRTEGWVAALQLAALSLEGRPDASAFIAQFAGDDRYVVDYLVEEVLQRQTEAARRFLMQTCLLERLSGPLCDAVTGRDGSGAILESLVRSNLFVVPLDGRREWYRYHHLFADVLQAHFSADLVDEGPVLHQRASDWFAANNAAPEAIGHAFAAGDVDRAAVLVERAIPEMGRTRQQATLRSWLEALPDDLVRARPVLGVGLVGTLMSMGVVDGVEARLRDAEIAMAAAESAEANAVVVDHDQLRSLPGAIELYRSALAQVRGDLPGATTHAQLAIERSPTDAHLVRAGAQGFLGIAHWTQGALEAAARSWTDCRDGLRRAGNLADIFGASIALADINVALGRLRAATQIYEDALEIGAAHRGHPLRGTADAHAGLTELHMLSGDPDLAGQHLVRSQELGEAFGLPQFPYRWRVAMANLRSSSGDAEGALDLLDEAERVYLADFFPNIRPIAAMKARVLIRQGRLVEAQGWVSAAGIDATDEVSYTREFEHITLARLLLAQGDEQPALGLLSRLRQAAEAGSRFGSLIEILALEALGHQLRGDDAALEPLERALALAEPEGFVSIFLDEAQPIAVLLKAAAKRGGRYARSLLAGRDQADDRRVSPASQMALIEPLSERELDVLRLLRSDLDGPDIARELKVSLNTMRTHTKNIYEKMGVNNRRAAVRRAEELQLLQRR